MHLFRKLSRNWQWVLINILGLTLAYACVALVFSFTTQELSYDRFHTKADQIYRVTTSSGDFSTMHPARVWGTWMPELPKEYPAIESLLRMVPYKKGIVQIGEQRFYSDRLFKVDSTFFDFYDFELISGDRNSVLTKPLETVITKSMAIKYFGDLNVLGKQIEITHQQAESANAFTIVGVIEDFPANSHFHAEALTTIPNVEVNNSWGYTYYMMQPHADVESLRQNIQTAWDERQTQEGGTQLNIHFQKLTDIHLFSHKTREIEVNGDVRSLILLASGGLIILFVALINFLNLSRVQFINDTKSFKIRMIHGATKSIIARELIIGSLFISIATILLGLLTASKLSTFLHIDIFAALVPLTIISIIFMVGIAALSVFPLITSPISTDTKVSPSNAGLYTFPLVIQFTLAVISITGTIVLERQMSFLSDQHPQSQNPNIVVIERNPWGVVQRYDQLKNKLLENPSIVNMTGAMEEPGGDILDNFHFEMEGIDPYENQNIHIFTTDSDFFTALDITPLAGSVNLGYTPNKQWEQDALELSQLVQQETFDQTRVDELLEKVTPYREKYILNASALKMLGIEDPKDAIGRTFRLNFIWPFLFPEGEIAAIVPDFHYTNLHNEERPLVITSRKMFNHNFLIEMEPNRKTEALAAINSAWQEINPEFPFQYGYINDSYKKVYAAEYAQSKVLSLFALISVFLSALGIYAIAAFSMQKRVKEIGIRKVNGASVTEIMTLLNLKFLILVSIAIVIAIPIAWYAMSRWLESFAYKTQLSWWIFALAGCTAAIIALITVSIQSYKAATRNPVESLKNE